MKESNQALIKNLHLIGTIRDAIGKSDSIEDALQKSLHCIADEIKCEYAIFWLAEKDGRLLHPHYWIGPNDFSHCIRTADNGVVGKVFTSNKPVSFLDYKKGNDPEIEKDIENTEFSSMLCLPFETDLTRGCIQLFHTDGRHFNSEMSDVCQILVLLISMTINDSDFAKEEWRFNDILLNLENIEKSFSNGEEKTKVLKKVNLKVFKGEFLVLLGESGCGKSTLLNIIGGMNRADSGTYIYGDRDLSNASRKELTAFRKNNVGFIQLILADEPTAALDYTTSIEVLSLLSNIIKHGSTLVMVTHNEEITRMADRVVRIRDGKVYEIKINRKPVPAEDLVW